MFRLLISLATLPEDLLQALPLLSAAFFTLSQLERTLLGASWFLPRCVVVLDSDLLMQGSLLPIFSPNSILTNSLRYSSQFVFPTIPSRDTLGIFTRNVSDAIFLDEIITSSNNTPETVTATPLEKLRVGIAGRNYEYLDDEVLCSLTDFGNNLFDNGTSVSYFEIGDLSKQSGFGEWPFQHEVLNLLQNYLKESGFDVSIEDFIKGLETRYVRSYFNILLKRATQNAKLYPTEIKQRDTLQYLFERLFDEKQIDVLVVAASPLASHSLEKLSEVLINYQPQPIATLWYRMSPFTIAGLPAITVPVDRSSEGVPIGVTIIGRKGQDKQLLAHALAIESAVRTHFVPPTLDLLN